MKYVPDRTGQFARRPHFSPEELDQECEKIITDFMRACCGGSVFPIPTDALTKLIERDTGDLDLYADLSHEGPEVHGVTDFFPDRKPNVRILESLSSQVNEHRLRTTLTHEYGHVKFHDGLRQAELVQPTMHEQLARKASPKCKRDGMISAPQTDWMEWQAGYVSGAILMPKGRVTEVVGTFLEARQLFGPILITTLQATRLMELLHMEFGVSRDAARVRLLKLGHLTETDLGPSLF